MKTGKQFIFILTIFLMMVFSPEAGRADSFDLFVVPTLDQKLDSWENVPSNLQPTVYIPAQIYPYQPFSLRALFKEYSLSALKNAYITYDVDIFYPDGKPTPDQAKDLIAYNGPIKNAKAIIINQQLIDVFFDESYPTGEYEIRITARDHYSKTTIARSHKITLAEVDKIAKFASLDFFNFWIKNYFRQPDTSKALFGILQYIDDNPDWLRENIRLISFARRLVQDNPWLWKHLVKRFQNNPEEQKKIILLMSLAGERVPEIIAAANKEENTYFTSLAKNRYLPDVDTDIKSLEQVDTLWGDFYASGHLDPFEKIVRSLNFFNSESSLEEQKQSKFVEHEPFRGLVDHLIDIPLATKFSSFLLDYREIGPRAKTQLRLALEAAEAILNEENPDNPAQDKKNPPSQPR